ncbi:acetamidase/formamidase family protein [Acidiphilium sp. AL]|uniref:Acetamidase/formamidase family protein n=1 Tax=Acidiphilium iwatense TaxID=768198 RepID=A0ABS9E194_9PROT|nr:MULTISPECIES: acetamidase/formamidase family protein [Acidiphilium]MCF3948772.1 acetamidase/formamidase family protein [Acidiphilium iwatense]MCU4162191.1 acetamidase/formamidase family protein [Acidiphilium sp. AL]
MSQNTYTVHRNRHHHGWNNAFAPVLRVAPGDVVTIETIDSSGGQLTKHATLEDLKTLDFDKVNPVTGPIFIDDARPGDALKITIEQFDPSGWGWTANIPGFGLLAEDFPDPALHIWHYDTSWRTPAAFGHMAKIPLKPFAGTIGVAPAASGHHSVVPPRRCGGNMDIRDLSAGTELYLPIEVYGALFSVGDTHAAQGDGEVCGTAIESAMTVTLRFDLIKGTDLKFPRATLPGPITRHNDSAGYEVTTGIGTDLMQGARDAVRGMIDLLAMRYGFSPMDAYMLCSIAADLKISELVDRPNWVVSLYLPRLVLE